jgi:hypothetical protein
LLSMILQKCAPSLRRRFAAAHHVFADAALTDVDAELEQLTVDPRCEKIEDRVARSVVREMSIGENNERKITPIRSNISRFLRGTVDCSVKSQVEPIEMS